MPRPRMLLDEDVIWNLASRGISKREIAAICGCSTDTLRDNYEALIRDAHKAATGLLISKAMEMAHNEKGGYDQRVQADMLKFMLKNMAGFSDAMTITARVQADAEDIQDPNSLTDDAIDQRINHIMGEVKKAGTPLQLEAGTATIIQRRDLVNVTPRHIRSRKAPPAGRKKAIKKAPAKPKLAKPDRKKEIIVDMKAEAA
jgi:lambda repressor-like predicted transcriptional regulator